MRGKQNSGPLAQVTWQRLLTVDDGQIIWDLDWNDGGKYTLEIEYMKELEWGRQNECNL